MDEEALKELVLDKMTKVCLCKAISRATMKKAIAGGADTVEKVRKATGAGSGPLSGASLHTENRRIAGSSKTAVKGGMHKASLLLTISVADKILPWGSFLVSG